MDLIIDTTKEQKISLIIKDGKNLMAKKIWSAPLRQSEELLVGIDELLQELKVKISAITKIYVNNKNGTFTSLRIGVVTANALAFALQIPVYSFDSKSEKTNEADNLFIVSPIYNKKPNITLKKSS